MRFRLPLLAALVGLAFVSGDRTARAQDDQKKAAPPVLRSEADEERMKAVRERMRKNREEAAAKKEEKAEEKTEKAEEKAEKAEEKAEEKTEKAAEKVAVKAKETAKVEEKTADLGALGEKIRARVQERRKTRDARRAKSRDQLKGRWKALLDSAQARAELRRHARRMARLEYIKELAESENKTKVVERADKLLTMETGRHERRMAEIDQVPADTEAK
jgi:hypothetical protein